jgi:pyridoxal phosphate enzyme (YggS family)
MSSNQNIYVATEAVRERMASAAARAGRKVEEIQLLAVTKFHAAEAVRAAYDAGIRLFGENRVQEAENKFCDPSLIDLKGYSLHMIGNLQSNKIGKAVELFDAIESIGDLATLDKVISTSVQKGKPVGLFLELHTGEATKGGFESPDTIVRAVERYLKTVCDAQDKGATLYPSLQGLMTMAPFHAGSEELRAAFRKLASTRLAILQRFPEFHSLELSMGMSGDFELAIEEGATIVRIGTALFGDREGS